MTELVWNGQTLLLPSAKLGNTVSLNLRTTIHQAMNGDYWTYVQRPNQKRLSLQFANLNRNKILETEAFIISTAGQRILLKDHDNVVWSGRVLNPFQTAHQAVRNSNFQLDFEITDR